MLPDTWLPTSTVVTAWSVPVAPTASMTSPRVAGAVVTWISADPRRTTYAPTPAPIAATMSNPIRAFLIPRPSLSFAALLSAAAALTAGAGALRARGARAAAGVDHGHVQVLQRRLLQPLELDQRLAVVENRAQL